MEVKWLDSIGFGRVISTIYLVSKSEYKTKESVLHLHRAAKKATEKYNVGKITVDKDKDFAFQTQFTFTDEISVEEVATGFKWAQDVLTTMVGLEELEKYIE